MATKKAGVKHRALGLSDEQALEMYWHILLARRIDERMWILHRQHEIVFHISGIGHEGTQVGAAFALKKGYEWQRRAGSVSRDERSGCARAARRRRDAR